MLANTNEKNRHVGRMDETDECANHVPDGITLGDDESIKGSYRAEGGVEVAGLSDGVGANKGLATRVRQSHI